MTPKRNPNKKSWKCQTSWYIADFSSPTPPCFRFFFTRIIPSSWSVSHSYLVLLETLPSLRTFTLPPLPPRLLPLLTVLALSLQGLRSSHKLLRSFLVTLQLGIFQHHFNRFRPPNLKTKEHTQKVRNWQRFNLWQPMVTVTPTSFW